MSVKYEYLPKGTCSNKFEFELDGDIIKSVNILGGCPGNLLGISKILKGKKYTEAIDAFKGVKCGNKPTSCPDQIATALEAYYNNL